MQSELQNIKIALFGEKIRQPQCSLEAMSNKLERVSRV